MTGLYTTEPCCFADYELDDVPFEHPVAECPECGKLGERRSDKVVHVAEVSTKRGGGAEVEPVEWCDIKPPLLTALRWMSFAGMIDDNRYFELLAQEANDDQRNSTS